MDSAGPSGSKPPPAKPPSLKKKLKAPFQRRAKSLDNQSVGTSHDNDNDSDDEGGFGLFSEHGDDEDHDEDDGNDNDTDMYISYMTADPIGSMLLAIAKDNIKMMRKLKIQDSNLNLKQISKNFYLQHINKEGLENRVIQNSVRQIEQNMLDRDLHSHRISQTFPPHKNFSPIPTLTTVAQRN